MADLVFALPAEIKLSREQFLQLFKDRCIEVSGGQLSDFSPASTLTVLAEAEAIALTTLEDTIERIIPLAIADTIARNINFPRGLGQKAVCIARFQIEGIYSVSFDVPRGHRFSLGIWVFETQLDLRIPANTDTANPANYNLCRVSAIALELGSAGNQPAQQANILQAIPGLLAIVVDEPSQGGQDEESLSSWYSRLSAIIAQAAQRDTLIKEQEFEEAARSILGEGIAIAVPELGVDRIAKQIAAMHVFVANKDGTAPTTAQLRQLSEQMAPRAPLARSRLYFSTMAIAVVEIEITIKVSTIGSLENIGDAVNEALRSVFSISETSKMRSLDFYRVIDTIYNFRDIGVESAFAQWGYQGRKKISSSLELAPIAPGSPATAPARIGMITMTFNPSGITRTYA